ncbi:MAG: hypothetical protein JNK89_05275 [Saprospiraceae bacterium]|nr:hypothetical protein [Saprospiraceae bacterium]
MKIYSIFLLTFSLLLMVACDKKDGILSFKLDTPFELKIGESATLEDQADVQIRFDKVLSDSRCPIDAECVWAGRAEIEVTFFQEGQSATTTLIMGDHTGTGYTEKAVFGIYTVTLKAVRPEPKADQPIPVGDYRIELEVSK